MLCHVLRNTSMTPHSVWNCNHLLVRREHDYVYSQGRLTVLFSGQGRLFSRGVEGQARDALEGVGGRRGVFKAG